MLWSTELSGRHGHRMEVPAAAPFPGFAGAFFTSGKEFSLFSDRRDVPLVVQAPRGVPHQTQRAVAPAAGHGCPRLDRRAQSLRRLAWELGVGPADGVQDVGVRAAELG